jgi:REP element-mobilizing transposase RayT
MSTKYKATTTEEAYFITITTVGWIDVFTRLNQKYNIINALNYCQKNKGLEIYAYVMMSNHLHLLCKATNGFVLSDVIRDFKNLHQRKFFKL